MRATLCRTRELPISSRKQFRKRHAVCFRELAERRKRPHRVLRARSSGNAKAELEKKIRGDRVPLPRCPHASEGGPTSSVGRRISDAPLVCHCRKSVASSEIRNCGRSAASSAPPTGNQFLHQEAMMLIHHDHKSYGEAASAAATHAHSKIETLINDGRIRARHVLETIHRLQPVDRLVRGGALRFVRRPLNVGRRWRRMMLSSSLRLRLSAARLFSQ